MLHDWFQSKTDQLLPVIRQLVDIRGGSYDAAAINQVVDIMHSQLVASGMTVERTPLEDRGDLLHAHLQFGVGGPTVTIVGHTDTVWPVGSVADWGFDADSDRVSGPGVGDMKAALVIASTAVQAIAHLPLVGRVEIVLVPDEQLGSVGSKAWLEEIAATSDYCLGLEAGGLNSDVVTSREAVGALVLKASGIAAHVTEPGGRSVLDALIPIAAGLPNCEHDGDQLRIGIMNAGTSRQVAPATGELHIDVRSPTTAAAAALVERVRALVQSCATAGVILELDGGTTRPAFESERSHLLFALASEIAADLGLELLERHERGGSDASLFAAAGAATLDGLGPACGNNCGAGEYITIESIPERGAILAMMIARLLAPPDTARPDLLGRNR